MTDFLVEEEMVYLNDDSGNMVAYVTFPKISDGVVNINRTFVDGSLRGQGIAGKLMDKVYLVLKERNLKARITCSYAVKYFSENKDKQDVLV